MQMVNALSFNPVPRVWWIKPWW